MTQAASQPVPAATLVLVRDGPGGLQTLMIVRHQEVAFAQGAAVFPGGKVAPSDSSPDLQDHLPAALACSKEEAALRVAAVRETFEESGLLLARSKGHLLDEKALADIGVRWHTRVRESTEGFLAMVQGEGLELAVDLLHPFAHWVTPESAPKRFDTRFFIANAPQGQMAAHDGREAVESFWVSPQQAMRDCEDGRRATMFPTLCNLALLGTSASAAAALAAAGTRTLRRIQPTLSVREDGRRIPVLPHDCGYPPLSSALMDRVAR